MLKNELWQIRELLFEEGRAIPVGCNVAELRHYVALVQEAWLNEVFSDCPKTTLERYFQFHLEGITKISDTLQDSGLPGEEETQNQLLFLIGHLEDFYSGLLNWNSNAPLAYHKKQMARLAPLIDNIRQKLKRPEIPSLLAYSIESWFDAVSDHRGHVNYTFRTLAYLNEVVGQLALLDWEAHDIPDLLTTLLFRVNFNSLAFLDYLLEAIGREAEQAGDEGLITGTYRKIEAHYRSIPLKLDLAYDHSWPAIKTMVTDWLAEQIHLSEACLNSKTASGSLFTGKLGLTISVADIACLIRLFHDEQLFDTENLREVFKFYAQNFASKRQPAISWESLSKEYYSLNFHNTATVKKIVQHMLDNLNRGFFPA